MNKIWLLADLGKFRKIEFVLFVFIFSINYLVLLGVIRNNVTINLLLILSIYFAVLLLYFLLLSKDNRTLKLRYISVLVSLVMCIVVYFFGIYFKSSIVLNIGILGLLLVNLSFFIITLLAFLELIVIFFIKQIFPKHLEQKNNTSEEISIKDLSEYISFGNQKLYTFLFLIN